KDNQEDKEPLFDAVDTLHDVLALLAELLKGIEPRPERMRKALDEGFATATDLADYLVRRGMPFRDAHEVVARAVRAAEEAGKDLASLPLATLRGYSALIGEDVHAALTPEGSVASRNHVGGTAPEAVRAAIERARKRL
ncbi:MAG TPA: argininosuccinate lyase, partial [Casimicrobiaceae bacterium]|nr:argininosuccinate lyase [Casimicrobiaceae bacterium]